MKGSPPLMLDGSDLQSILRGALLAAGGALVTYFSVEVIPNLDDSTVVGAIIAGCASTLLNVLRKYLTDTQES